MDHLEQAECRTDGWLDPKVIRLERARDLLARSQRPNPHCRIRIRTIVLKPEGVIASMANALIAATQDRGRAAPQDLRRAGFTAEQIAEYGDDAVALARGMRPDLDRCRA